jgi:hypothetical protein
MAMGTLLPASGLSWCCASLARPGTIKTYKTSLLDELQESQRKLLIVFEGRIAVASFLGLQSSREREPDPSESRVAWRKGQERMGGTHQLRGAEARENGQALGHLFGRTFGRNVSHQTGPFGVGTTSITILVGNKGASFHCVFFQLENWRGKSILLKSCSKLALTEISLVPEFLQSSPRVRRKVWVLVGWPENTCFWASWNPARGRPSAQTRTELQDRRQFDVFSDIGSSGRAGGKDIMLARGHQ